MGEPRRFRVLPDDPEVGKLPYLWLVYLAFVFIGPVFMEVTDVAWIWVATTGSVVAFLPLYFAAYWTDGWRRAALGLAICGLGTAICWFNTGASTFFTFGAFFGGLSGNTRLRGVLYLLPSLFALLLTSIFVQPSAYFWVPALLGAIAIGSLGVAERVRVRGNADLRIARAEVAALARIAERERIARDLHDLLGQSLSVVSLKAELAARLLDTDPTRAAAELKDIHDVARQSLSEVRTAVQGYRIGHGAGLRHELDNAKRALAAAGVQLHCDDDLSPLAQHLDAEHEVVVALALREGVTNIVRHADAQACHVRFWVQEREFGVEIRDDGRGGRAVLGAGLLGMLERVEALGGRIELLERPGTTIRLTFDKREAA